MKHTTTMEFTNKAADVTNQNLSLRNQYVSFSFQERCTYVFIRKQQDPLNITSAQGTNKRYISIRLNTELNCSPFQDIELNQNVKKTNKHKKHKKTAALSQRLSPIFGLGTLFDTVEGKKSMCARLLTSLHSRLCQCAADLACFSAAL